MALALGRVKAVHVGPVKTFDPPAQADERKGAWTSGIYKFPVTAPVMVRTSGIDGDGQADLVAHGGVDGAVLAYAAGHYPMWEQQIGRPLEMGVFGENLTVTGFDDTAVCLGDIWEIGDSGGLRMQVTQSRQPCYKLARRMGEPRIVKWITEGCNGGWYFRVLREGPVTADMEIRLVERGQLDWPVCEAVRVMYAKANEPHNAKRLREVEALSSRWKTMLINL
ncbi:MAG TPA: MOSC domain-containing protein [Tepidisphaeraceae bacterium]|jgi:MOSC domain-containing protein YiiM